MLELTQTSLKPGNCVQTAVACVLEVPAENLPDQVAIEHPPEASKQRQYLGALQAYLWKHHGLMYVELDDYQFAGIGTLRDPGHHILIGPTVRTVVEQGEPRILHAVVGHHGQQVWDPHPSRAGLTSVERWSLIVPVPGRIDRERREHIAAGHSYWVGAYTCVCPACAPVPALVVSP